jgi:hypothetical protein
MSQLPEHLRSAIKFRPTGGRLTQPVTLYSKLDPRFPFRSSNAVENSASTHRSAFLEAGQETLTHCPPMAAHGERQ